ncbi:MAG: lamin tail domain-containing protein, partial [Planctomycetes bacterium]|nr:lamin tail domain-containing protein [Planctomycetota bacterium]
MRRRAIFTGIERLEPRQMLAADLVISEFLARNETGITDADGERPDWIEVHNPSSAAIDLEGWYLTDKADNLRKWRFPSRSIEAGEYLVVFASENNRREEELHTNFKLTAGGEFLALVHDEPDPLRPGRTVATIVQQFAPEFPQQLADVSYGVPIVSSPLPLLTTGATAQVLVPENDSLALDWTLSGFVPDALWSALPTGVGYDTTSDFDAEIAGDLSDLMQDVNSAVYLRLPFSVDDPSVLETLQLRMKYDAGFVAFLNGLLVIGENAPALDDLRFNSVASQERSDVDAVVFQSLDITSDLDLLVPGTNVLSIVGLNSSATDADFLMVPELHATTSRVDVDSPRYFSTPTPGEPNGSGAVDLGPIFSEVTHTPPQPGVSEAIVVTAGVAPSFDPIVAVSLHYRVMYAAEVTLAMRDDGQGADVAAGDGVFTAVIPAGIAEASEMVRWRVTASDEQATLTRSPAFAEPTNSPEYFGTVVLDASIDTQLPMIHWFAQDTSAADNRNRTGTRASVYFDGEFYDNVFIRIRGGSTTRTARPSHKIDFNDGHHFRWRDGERRVDEFNLNTNLTEKAYLRQELAFETLAAAGVPSPATFLVRVKRNGVFYGLDTWIEQVDRDFLRRNGLDPDGALYKMFNRADNAEQAEKKTRREEDRSDLQDLIEGINLAGAGRLTYLLDNVNIPELMTYIAANTIISDRDYGTKNYYFYRDTEGDELWQLFPWDKDLTFGRNWNGGLFQDLVSFNNSPTDVSWNHLIGAVYQTPMLREMYLRRLRTLMDEMLQPPDTPADQLKFEQRLDEFVELALAAANDDFERWATGNFGGQNGWTWGDPFRRMDDAVDLIKTGYLDRRRDFLFIQNGIGTIIGIPNEQPDIASRPDGERGISFAAIEFNPVSGNQDEEFIELVNSNSVAIDISGWKLSGGVEHTFQPGVVIPAGGTLYVTPNSKAFRARASGPSGGQNLLIEGGYQGHLSARGETITLVDVADREIISTSYQGQPSEAQQFLRLSELMFHPAADDSGRDADDFEFIELLNTGPSALNLAGVQFTSGVQFTFDPLSLPAGGRVVVVKNLDAFAERYDTANMIVVGPFTSGTLDNGGEKIKLVDAANEEIVEFRYDDDWHPITDGEGFSLTLVDESVRFDLLGDADVWRPSSFLHGTPGSEDLIVTP